MHLADLENHVPKQEYDSPTLIYRISKEKKNEKVQIHRLICHSFMKTSSKGRELGSDDAIARIWLSTLKLQGLAADAASIPVAGRRRTILLAAAGRGGLRLSAGRGGRTRLLPAALLSVGKTSLPSGVHHEWRWGERKGARAGHHGVGGAVDTTAAGCK